MAVASRDHERDLRARLVQQLQANDVQVPPYPAVASALSRLEPEARPNLSEIAAVVAIDPALAATVLRHAASAAHKSNAPPTLESAIAKLGIDELMRVVVAASVGALATVPGPLAVLRRDLWRRSLLAALLGRELAQRRGIQPEHAFLAGLLHEFGAVVAIACIEGASRDGLPLLTEAAWRRLIDELHVEFGMVVAARWRLPAPITEAIASHHSPASCSRLYRPLVQLVANIDQAIEILDRGTEGLAGLVEVPGLEHDERYRIGALVPRVAEQMAAFEAPATREVPSAVAPPPPLLDGGWPVDFPIEGRNRTRLRACAVAPSALAFVSPVPLAPGWLTQLSLQCAPDTIAMLANVKTCEPRPQGDHLVTAQPFGLDGEDKAAWLRLIARARPSRR